MPNYANGKICYVEIPAQDIQRSADFYTQVFGWKTRKRGDGSTAFDDGVGEVSGTWVRGRKPMSEVGLLFYIMVDDAESAVKTASCTRASSRIDARVRAPPCGASALPASASSAPSRWAAGPSRHRGRSRSPRARIAWRRMQDPSRR